MQFHLRHLQFQNFRVKRQQRVVAWPPCNPNRHHEHSLTKLLSRAKNSAKISTETKTTVSKTHSCSPTSSTVRKCDPQKRFATKNWFLKGQDLEEVQFQLKHLQFQNFPVKL